jgi:HD-GYP domain-containing protein (c-di-GMP phosphodiesterase class II)
MEHTLRTCIVAVRLAETLGLAEAAGREVYYVALLRPVGCTASAREAAEVLGDELAAGAWFATVDQGRPLQMLTTLLRHVGAGEPPVRRAARLATTLARMSSLLGTVRAHCEVAQAIAGRLGLPEGVSVALGQVFERWDGRGAPTGLKGEAIVVPARLVQLAHDAVIHHALGGVEAAVDMARRRSGGAHDPRLAKRFSQNAAMLLAGLGEGSDWEAAIAAEPGGAAWLDDAQFDAALRAMADFVDLKSPSTLGHSEGVAGLAAEAARRCKLPGEQVVAVRRAGLVHDLGRVGVTSAVWERPGPLADGEWEKVRLHPYYTERILARQPMLAALGALAARHHERLDGSGYHRGAAASQLAPAARVLAAADAYHAMTEARPHRSARPPEAAAEELRREARAGRLDADVVNGVLAAAGRHVSAVRRGPAASLSAREVEVLRLLARGASKRQVAQKLTIAPATVDHHVRHIYEKLGVSTRAAATFAGLEHHLLGDAAAQE